MKFTERLSRAWNAFNNKDPTYYPYDSGFSSYSNPYRPILRPANARTILGAIYNRIAIDVAANTIHHVKTDENGFYESEVDDSLNYCLTVEANKDQTARVFLQNVAMSLMDEGNVAVVPIDTNTDINSSSSYDIYSMRVCQILEWRPDIIRVRGYNDRTGQNEEMWMPKSEVAIIENPFYEVMNSPNSTLMRLKEKIMLLDSVDKENNSGKFNMIIRLPYTVKVKTRQEQADKRLADLEQQLEKSKYGIAYMDATEQVTQLNRPLENGLMEQVQYLTNQLYSQLSISEAVLNNTASEQEMNNYMVRTIEPIISTITDAYNVKFLTKTARSQRHAIMYFTDPLKFLSISNIGDVADKLTRNEIMSSNEIRRKIGLMPSNDPNADALLNKNINHPEEEPAQEKIKISEEEIQNEQKSE